MRIQAFMATAAAAALIASAPAHGQFEGAVRMRAVSYGDGDSNVVASTVYFKGKLFAAVIDSSGGAPQAGKFILRADRNLMWIIVDPEKRYMEIPLPEKPPGADSSGKGEAKKSYTLTKTGRERTIIGYPCEEWIADEGGGVSAKIWATTKLGNMYEGVVKWFDEMSAESPAGPGRWERELASGKYFPLSVVRSEEGEITGTEEVTAVERRKVADAMFEAPAGYEKQVLNLDFEKMFEEMMKEMENEPGHEPDADTSSGGHEGAQ